MPGNSPAPATPARLPNDGRGPSWHNARAMILARSLAAAALAGVLAAQEAPLKFVDGRPVVLVTLRAGDAIYPCHLLVDLARREPLFLHSNAARSLGALECDVSVDGSDLTFEDLPVVGERDRWLEGFTAQNAAGLKEIPLAGYLGLGAFGDATLVIDGPAGTLTRHPAAAGFEKPPAAAGRGITDLAAKPSERGVRFDVIVTRDGRRETFALHTREAASLIAPRVAGELDARTGRVSMARAGAVDLATVTPFRPDPPPLNGVAATIGGRALSKLTTTIALGGGWIAFERPADVAYPEDEASYYDALYGENAPAKLSAFLESFPDSDFRADAARARLELTVERGAAPAEVVETAVATIEAAAAKQRASEALEILENLPATTAWSDARIAIAEKGLEFANDAEDGTANHKLHLELGRLARRAGDLKEARRHLLSTAFGMRGDGPANLELGRLYEQQGEDERAFSRYLIALLDMEETGEQGLEALRALHEKTTGSTESLPEVLADMAEGRIPSLHPIPRAPEEVKPTGKVVLAELFTGAMCPPCAAADVAFDALGEFFGSDEVALIQWHVPIPAPEPLVAEVSLDRLRKKGVRGTPTAVFGGTEVISGGGKADQAPLVFAKYRDALLELLKAEPTARIAAEASVADGVVRLSAFAAAEGGSDLRLHAVLTEATLIFPGRNGILFHHHVARARLTPADGVPLDLAAEELPFVTRVELAGVRRDLDRVVASLETREPFRIRPIDPSPTSLSVVLFLEDPASGKVVHATTVEVTPGS